MGFETGRSWRQERHVGLLMVVGFPEGWEIKPAFQGLETVNPSFAIVSDETGTPQLEVFYRNSVAGDSLKGHTHLVHRLQDF
jgi:hypothetical protein